MTKVKVRFLQSAFIVGKLETSYGYNDETEVDVKLAENLKEQGIVDILVEDPIKDSPAKPEKAAPKTRGRGSKAKEVEAGEE